MSTRHGPSGFTLIELLVVIAIVVIMAAIFYPMLHQAKMVGYRASCQSNLKQLMTAAHLYADDWGSYLPPVDSLGGNPGVNALGQQVDVDPWSLFNLLRRYTKSKEVFKCDVAPWAFPWDPGNGNYGVINYGYHQNAVVIYNSQTRTYSQAKRRENVTYPTKSVLMLDWWEWVVGWGGIHQCGANYAFVDGHVRWASVNEWGQKKGYPPFYYQ